MVIGKRADGFLSSDKRLRPINPHNFSKYWSNDHNLKHPGCYKDSQPAGFPASAIISCIFSSRCAKIWRHFDPWVVPRYYQF